MTSDKTTREHFLERLGLAPDPFLTPVAEQELGRVHDRFYSFYVSPALTDINGDPLSGDPLHLLRSPQHTFLFGDSGSGKSTLRLNLEADCRTVLDGTLAITYILGEEIEKPPSTKEHGARLAQSLAMDSTLAVIEQFNPLLPFSEDRQQALERIAPLGNRRSLRVLRILQENLNKAELDPVWGLGAAWKAIGKAPVKYVGASPELGTLLDRLIEAYGTFTVTETGWGAFWSGLALARRLGFERFLILVDGVDARSRSIEIMRELIVPLLEILHKFDENQVYVKCFLPMELLETLRAWQENCTGGLHSPLVFSIMNWDVSGLRRLAAQRLRAANVRPGPPYPGLNSLAEPGFDLEKRVLEAAGTSPRRLFGVINALIDVHCRFHPELLQLTQEDWERTSEMIRQGIFAF